MHKITLATNRQTNTTEEKPAGKNNSEALCIELVDVTGKIKGEKREAHEQTNSNHIIDKVGFEGLGKHQNKQQQQQQHLSVCLDQSVPWFNV